MARYFLRYRHSDTGLTPTFNFFKKASDLSNQAAPAISELSNGTYYFDYAPTFDVVFEVDGGASIPTEEVRYISDTIGPRDTYVDEPTSQVKDDVWDDATDRAAGSKGDFVEHIGINTDAVDAATIFGKLYKARDVILGGTGFGGTGVDIKTAQESIKGVDDRDLTALAGTGFVTGTDSLKVISDVLDVVAVDAATAASNTPASPSSIAGAVWDEIVAGGPHVVANSAAVVLKAGSLETTAQAIKTKTDNLPANTATVLTNLGTQLTRALGMMHENSVLDQTVFDGDNNLTAGRFRTYDSKANAIAAGLTGLVATYTITATYTGGNLTTYSVVQEP